MIIRSDHSVLVTGGTGSFGGKFVERLLSFQNPPKRIIIYSRDEFKQSEMRKIFNNHNNLRFFVGDIRDEKRLYKALKNVDYVFHASALKQVDSCEYNPSEAVKTNVLGAMNLIEACIERGVKQVVALSSDKAVNPINLYGATKLVSEKLFIAANAEGAKQTKFSVVRYGNVLGSRGSVVQLFKEQAKNGEITITVPYMTRFWWILDQAVDFVMKVNNKMIGGEIFVPKLKASTISQLAHVVAPGAYVVQTDIRPGEKLHEVLIAPDEVNKTHDLGWCYAVYPSLKYFDMDNRLNNPVGERFSYASNDPDKMWSVSEEDMKDLSQLIERG